MPKRRFQTIVQRSPQLESLEGRWPLDASGLAGNACAPDLDLSAVSVQAARVQEEIILDLRSVGATVGDQDGDGNPTTDTVRFQLDPDDGPANATLSSDGIFRWTPTADQIGEFDFIVIAVDEGSPPLADAEVLTIEVIANEAPNLEAIEDVTLAINEPWEITLTATDGEANNLTFLIDPDQQPVEGLSLEQVEDTTALLRWTPNATFAGQSLPVSILVVDDGFPVMSDNETFVISLATVGAVDDAYQIEPGEILAIGAGIGVLANDVDAEGNPLTATVVEAPSHGTLSLAEDGSFTYTPDSGFQGSDSFRYEASDDGGNTSIGVVAVVVHSTPIAADDNYRTPEDTTLNIGPDDGLLANDVDTDGDPLTVDVLQAPDRGTLTLNEAGSFTYVPDAGYAGTVTFTYALSAPQDDRT